MRALSLIIPAYNEEKKIAKDLKETASYLQTQSYNSEVVVVNDGSRDQTREVVLKEISALETEKVRFHLVEYLENRGKGYAIQQGVEKAEGEIIGFLDSGMCVPLSFIQSALETIHEGADCALGSRRLKNSQMRVKQPFYRRVGSYVFWKLMRLFMGIGVSDTQCGFKFYRKQTAKEVFSLIRTTGFMFDIEALSLCKRLDYKVKEFPVAWSNDSDTRYHPFWGTLRNLRELFLIKIRRH